MVTSSNPEQIIFEMSREQFFLKDQLQAMLVKEGNLNIDHSLPIQDAKLLLSQQHEWRSKICEWCYRIIDHFQYDREVVSIAMDYFDRMLLSKCFGSFPVPSSTYQLTAMSSLYIAIKCHGDHGDDESCHRNHRLCINSYVELSRGQFTRTQILSMEQTILETLEWKVNPITPMCFVSYFVRMFPETCEFMPQNHWDLILHILHELSRYFTELAICLVDVTNSLSCKLGADKTEAMVNKSFQSSSIAFASILISMELISIEALPYDLRMNFLKVAEEISCDALAMFPGDQDKMSHLSSELPHIQYLKEVIRNNFSPATILEESEDINSNHPITIAKNAGILNISAILNGEEGLSKATRGNANKRPSVTSVIPQLNGKESGSPTSVMYNSKIDFHATTMK